MSNNGEMVATIVMLGLAIAVIMAVVGGVMVGYPVYKVWQKEKAGQAELAQAGWNRQIQVEEAKASKESAKFKAEADIIRAEGVAEANRIIGESLQDNEEYLQYCWIEGLHDGSSEVIYVPTEAQLPILEAGKRVFAVGGLE